jgi:hypothetical protein
MGFEITIPAFERAKIVHALDRSATVTDIADLHTLQITRAHEKFSQSAFTSRFLVTDLKNGDSSASMVTPLPEG